MTRLFFTALIIVLPTLSFAQKKLIVGQLITGDFNGDGKIDTAYAKLKRNPNTKTKSWTLSFSDKTIPSIQLGCCEIYLINEGDLNKNKTTEISVFQAPENGCTYMWTTYSYKAKHWTKLIPTFLVPTGCDSFTGADLKNKVFTENGKVYYWDTDPNDEKNKPIKKQITINYN